MTTKEIFLSLLKGRNLSRGSEDWHGNPCAWRQSGSDNQAGRSIQHG